ncbi:MAG: glycosyltransferase family 4 protein [Chloroflexi bacterium]|nr:glycosyltransferase family 4 protein [Chloroflexota bacterium]
MSNKLKVLIVDHAPIFGGVEAMITDLIGAMDREKFTLTMATDTASRVEFRDVDVRRLPMPRVRENLAAMITAGLRLAAVARHAQADVMMTTTARTHAIGAVAARVSGAPLVWRLADDTFPLPLAATLSSIPKRIITVSSFIAGRCSPSPAKTIIIPDGLPDTQPQTKLTLNTGKPVAVMIARLVRWKGHAVFARAVKLANVAGVIVGGEDESEGELGGKGLKAELAALNGEIQFLGQRSDVRDILAASDIFIHASTRPEPFGRVLVQAMLAGVPVIASRAGATAEVVGNAGLLVPTGDVEALAEALKMDAVTRARLGREGRERALARFELGAMTRRLEQVWQDVAGV